ncbi:MAG: sigma-70 family RNA polymerase sigma factor [Desulfobulbaceae bacterium]|nr:sigma-70 family RNA polymerase sigma factor [Desulfobulbaceae bacterium]MCK5544274.1 sigma-70 family RNA polymerase sigma factor [Desulfobulbaceae bacterium]
MSCPKNNHKEKLRQETAELVKALRKGDSQPFNRLVMLYQTGIYNLALNYLKVPEEAKDITQDIFITAYRSLSMLRDDSKFSAWLYQIAVNHCRNRLKKLQRRGFFTSRSLDNPEQPIYLSNDDSPERQIEQKDRTRIVRKAIAAMPEAEKEVLIMRDLQEMTYEEISEVLGVPLGTVKSKLNRARNALKNKIKHLF